MSSASLAEVTQGVFAAQALHVWLQLKDNTFSIQIAKQPRRESTPSPRHTPLDQSIRGQCTPCAHRAVQGGLSNQATARAPGTCTELRIPQHTNGGFHS